MDKYRVHGGKSISIAASDDDTKTEENEFFATETFGSKQGHARDPINFSLATYNPALFRHPRDILNAMNAMSSVA